MKCGVVGLPNVGKSTLFNALAKKIVAESANYPFCTIEKNIGSVSVQDPRLQNLAKISGSKKTIPTSIDIVDIAGLVRGASTGKGLGNKFLSHIREVDLILHIVRTFDDPEIIHIEGNVDPIRDIDIINTELLFADLETLERKKKKSDQVQNQMIDRIIKKIEQNSRLVLSDFNNQEIELITSCNPLSLKKMIYICNGSQYADLVKNHIKNASIVTVNNLGQDCEHDLNNVILTAYQELNLLTFFTSGPEETRAWQIKQGSTARTAAGAIHSDMERGFICAETISYRDMIEQGSIAKVKSSGKMRIEGRDYKVQDGDIMTFRFNV